MKKYENATSHELIGLPGALCQLKISPRTMEPEPERERRPLARDPFTLGQC